MSKNNVLYFPREILIRLVDELTRNPVPNIVISLTIYAKAKNNYHLRPALSNSEGMITIKYDWVKKSIDEVRNFFLMDYTSPLEECFSHISLKVISTNEIPSAISAMKLYGVEMGGLGIAHTVSDMKNAENTKYEPQNIQIELSTPGETRREISIKLRRIQKPQ